MSNSSTLIFDANPNVLQNKLILCRLEIHMYAILANTYVDIDYRVIGCKCAFLLLTQFVYILKKWQLFVYIHVQKT